MKRLIAICMCITLLCGCSCGKSEGGGIGVVDGGSEITTIGDENIITTNNIAESDTIESTTEPTTQEVTTEESTTEVITTEIITEETMTQVVETTTEEKTTQQQTSEKKTTTTTKAPEPTTQQETTTYYKVDETGKTPYEAHGRLQVNGTKLVDQYGTPYQLKGASTHGMAWFPQYVSYDTFKYMRDNFGVNVVRLAMYTVEYNGYCEGGDKNYLKNLVKQGVQAATDLGLYVIIDWHILYDLNPQVHKGEAIEFFREMSSIYKDYDNIIYEICNEPNGNTSWADIKAYANEVIPVIRANDKDAIIIVGTPTWSQDVDTASNDKITGYDNIMYALHFYAATHKDWLRNKAQKAIDNGCALFVSEFSICDASGNGGLDKAEAEKWIQFLNKNGISYVGWSMSNKAETSALFQSWCGKISGFDDSELTEWALWLRSVIKK